MKSIINNFFVNIHPGDSTILDYKLLCKKYDVAYSLGWSGTSKYYGVSKRGRARCVNNLPLDSIIFASIEDFQAYLDEGILKCMIRYGGTNVLIDTTNFSVILYNNDEFNAYKEVCNSFDISFPTFPLVPRNFPITIGKNNTAGFYTKSLNEGMALTEFKFCLKFLKEAGFLSNNLINNENNENIKNNENIENKITVSSTKPRPEVIGNAVSANRRRLIATGYRLTGHAYSHIRIKTKSCSTKICGNSISFSDRS